FQVWGAPGTVISNLAVTGDYDIGFYIRASDNSVVKDVTMTGTFDYAAVYPNRGNNYTVSNVKIDATVTGWYAGTIFLYDTQNITATGNTISGNSIRGIYAISSHDATITGNTITGSIGINGIDLNISPSGKVTGNTIPATATYRHGIRTWNSPDAKITDNTISGEGRMAIVVMGGEVPSHPS
ncbi:unnamed protein product, partial [marine sediment metagenome]